MRTKIVHWLAGVVVSIALVGCGSSSSSQASRGIYKDAGVVSGLTYTTATQSGVTDQEGGFRYMPGETVTFSISNITIGQATGAPTITTFDLVGIAPPLSSFGIPQNNPTSNKFQEAINISLFLQTLDEDSNPANGIRIPTAVNSVVANTPIDFKLTRSMLAYRTFNSFQDSPQLKVFIGSCRTAGIWGGIKAIQQQAIATSKLYQSLGLTPAVYVALKTTNSDNSYSTREYANNGFTSKLSYYDANGNLTSYTTYTYDANGNQTHWAYTDSTNSSNNALEDYLFDANGNQIRRTYTTSNGANIEIWNAEYDINGNQTKITGYNNGTLTGYSLYFYNTNGTLSRDESYDANNVLNFSSSFAYNANLQITGIESTGPNSQPTSLVLTYNQNQSITKAVNYTAGVLDSTTTIAYDSAGNPSSFLQTDASGAQTFRSSYTWDTNAYMVAAANYGSNNQLQWSNANTYDANGSLISETSTSNGVTSTTTYTYINQSGWGELLGYYTWFGGPS